jgi:hypothetical protein
LTGQEYVSYETVANTIFLDESMKLIDGMEEVILSNGGDPRSIIKLREYVEQLPKPDAA